MASIGKPRGVLVAEPADVVQMAMGEDHRLNVLARNARSLEA